MKTIDSSELANVTGGFSNDVALTKANEWGKVGMTHGAVAGATYMGVKTHGSPVAIATGGILGGYGGRAVGFFGGYAKSAWDQSNAQ